jgi:NitT/TauT family transport system ATP-binding protein
MEEIIVFDQVSLTYPNEPFPALSDVSFSISKGQFVSFLGPSGCGKTTILKIVSGLEVQTSGSVKKPEQVSMAFQFGALFPWLTVFENVALGLRQKHRAEADIRAIVTRELRTMQIEDFAGKYPSELSGGQRQRVGIARALAIDPQVLLLDEPFSALDPATTAELHRDILALWKEKHITILLISHSIEEAVGLSDKVFLMNTGKIERTFEIHMPHPRHEQEAGYMREVNQIRNTFFREKPVKA